MLSNVYFINWFKVSPGLSPAGEGLNNPARVIPGDYLLAVPSWVDRSVWMV